MKAFIVKLLTIITPLVMASCSRQHPASIQQGPKADSLGRTDTAASSTSPAGVPVVEKTMTYEQREGKFLYTKYCLICHGSEGKGDGFNAFNLDPKPKDLTDKQFMQASTDAALREIVVKGGRGVNKPPLMPSWGGRLTKAEIDYCIAYIRTFAE
jgi:mono/diheme cytochrome c family protein